MSGQLKLLDHQVSTPFDPPRIANDGISNTNSWIRTWWDERTQWLEAMGQGTWNAYRIPAIYTCFVANQKPPEGNNNIDDIVLWCFSDAQTAALFKLTWGGK